MNTPLCAKTDFLDILIFGYAGPIYCEKKLYSMQHGIHVTQLRNDHKIEYLDPPTVKLTIFTRMDETITMHVLFH